MCGIFGLVRNDSAAHPERASAAFVELGNLAIARGEDAAGFAVSRALRRTGHTTPTFAHATAKHTTIDGITIVKDTRPFPEVWSDRDHLPLIAEGKVVMGHTRWATQGAKSLVNASPMLVGSLVGTHNGDVTTSTLPSDQRSVSTHSTTDSAALFASLSARRLDRRRVVDTLTDVQGRAALAWLDRARSDRLYLARAALSPLALAYDIEGNLYWASVPDWFRQVDRMFDGALGFTEIVVVREGTLITVGVSGAEPVLEDQRTFSPICRARDDRLSDIVVWRGFDRDDMYADQEQANHRVAGETTRFGGRSWSGAGGGSRRADATYPAWMGAPVDDFRYGYSDLSDPDDPDFDEDSAFDEDDLEGGEEAVDRQEVDDAVLEWAEEGNDPDVVQALRDAVTEEETEALRDRYRLSNMPTFRAFRTGVLAWADSMVDSV